MWSFLPPWYSLYSLQYLLHMSVSCFYPFQVTNHIASYFTSLFWICTGRFLLCRPVWSTYISIYDDCGLIDPTVCTVDNGIPLESTWRGVWQPHPWPCLIFRSMYVLVCSIYQQFYCWYANINGNFSQHQCISCQASDIVDLHSKTYPTLSYLIFYVIPWYFLHCSPWGT